MKDQSQAFRNQSTGASLPARVAGWISLGVRFDASLRQQRLRSVYKGQVIYGRDAFSDLASWMPWRSQTGRHSGRTAGISRRAQFLKVWAWAASLNPAATFRQTSETSTSARASPENGLPPKRQLKRPKAPVQPGSPAVLTLGAKTWSAPRPFPRSRDQAALSWQPACWMKAQFLG